MRGTGSARVEHGLQAPGVPEPAALHPGAAASADPRVAPTLIRPISEDDLPAVAATLTPAPNRTHRDDLNWHRSGIVTHLIAWQASMPVGAGFMHWTSPRHAAIAALLPGCPEIFRLEALAPYRSRGIGTALLEALESLARERADARALVWASAPPTTATRHRVAINTTLNLLSDTAVEMVSSILFDRTPEQIQRVHAVKRDVMERLGRHDVPLMRLDIDAQNDGGLFADESYRDLLVRLKRLFDPNGVIAPGRYIPQR